MSALRDTSKVASPTPSEPPAPRSASGWVGRSGFERACAIACLAISCFIGLRAEALVSSSGVSRPGAFPPHGALWLGAGVLGLASLAWTIQLFRRRAQPPSHVGAVREVWPVFAVLLAGAWSAQWLGLLLAAGLTYVALMFYYRDKSRTFIAVSVVAYVAFLHFGMEVLLKVPLPRSPFFELPF